MQNFAFGGDVAVLRLYTGEKYYLFNALIFLAELLATFTVVSLS